MAEIQLFRITMLVDRSAGNPAFTHLDVGGQFASYYNDSNENIIVRDLSDDSQLTTSDFPTILVLNGATDFVSSPNQVADGVLQTAFSTYSICFGSDLRTFELPQFVAFPYAQIITVANSTQCNAFTCDLSITSLSTTKDDGTGTGTATVVATSAVDIQFSLIPFTYGGGNASNVFSELLEGNYTAYAVDEYGCSATANFSIGLNRIEDYALKYRIGYVDVNGKDARFDIKEKDFSGSSAEIISGSSPLVYDNQEKNQFDIFTDPIRAANVTINIPELTKFGYREFFTQDSKQYLGIWTKDTGSGFDELWRGFLQPEIFSASYGYQPDLSLTFIDQLNRLDKFQYADGNKFYNDRSLIKIIAEGLRKTDLDLPIRVAVNMYEDSHDSAASDDPLDQTFIDQETFYDDDGEPEDYKKVIERILMPFGAKIIQYGGYWYIIRIEEQKDASIAYRQFDVNGDYVSNGTYSPRIELRQSCVTDARGVLIGDSTTYEILPSPKNIIIDGELILRGSLLENYDFEQGEDFISFKNAGSTATSTILPYRGDNVFRFNNIAWTANLRNTRVDFDQSNIQYREGDSLRFSVDVATGIMSDAFPYMIVKAKIKVGSYYLRSDDTWTTSDVIYRFYPSPANGFINLDLEVEFPETNVTVDTTLDVSIYDYQAKNPDFGEFTESFGIYVLQDGVSAFRAQPTTSLTLGERYTVFGDLTGIEYLYFYTLEESTDDEDLPNVLHPTDFHVTTNTRVWRSNGYVKIDRFANTGLGFDLLTAKTNRFFYVNDVVLLVLPNSAEPPTNSRLNASINNSEEDLNYDLSIIDLPATYISSAKYQYNNLLRLSDGSNTQNWTRDGVAESAPIQQIFAQTVVRQYSTQTSKLSGPITGMNSDPSNHIEITPLSTFVETQDGGKIYIQNGIRIEDKELLYNVNMVDCKATAAFDAAAGFCVVADGSGGDDDGGGDGGSYSGGFSSGFGAGFNISIT